MFGPGIVRYNGHYGGDCGGDGGGNGDGDGGGGGGGGGGGDGGDGDGDGGVGDGESCEFALFGVMVWYVGASLALDLWKLVTLGLAE